MSWKEHFDRGVKAFRSSNLEEALTHFTRAVESGGNHVNLYDSRAAVLERLGRSKDALKDAKATIDADPARWQGYARASRLFLELHKYAPAITMADMALERLKNGDARRAEGIVAIKRKAETAHAALAQREQARRAATFYHFGKLPVEIITSIFLLHADAHPSGSIMLSHVCQHWRGIALNTPALWSTLILSRHPRKKALLWHSRTGGMIRELIVRHGVSGTGMPPFKCLRVFKTSSSEMTVEHLLEPLDVHEQEQLIIGLEEVMLQDCPTRALVSQTMPALRHLEIRSVTTFDWNAAATHITSLRTLIVHESNYPLGGVLTLLRANSMLEVVSFMAEPGKAHLFASGADVDLTGFPLPCLRSLEIGNFDVWSDLFFVVISAPSLESLKLTALRSRQDAVLHKLKMDGIPHLRELRIQKCSVSPTTILRTLQHADALETLELSHMGDVSVGARMGGDINVIIEALADGPQGGDASLLCPSLQHLNVSNSPDVKTGPLIRLVKAHLAGDNKSAESQAPQSQTSGEDGKPKIKPLQSLIMDGCPLIDSETLPWFRSKVPLLSCAYMSKKAAGYKR
ncbi:hypothetical protein OE88DRAFT_654163 [Heliocybe sulcata]|uniref:Uncharacterized protein n=1 Tax=Heliocybe sulcata TaxID=5364 RepID=A0A5C3NI25_9AGAM|nr:hypothetical protein OE88DRAFT_654163 [Heliocybe sulcata]